MDQHTLSVGRDVALIILITEAAVLGLAPGLVLYYLTRWLAGFLPQVPPFLGSLTGEARNLGEKVKGIMLKIATPFILLHVLATGVRRTVSVILRRR